MSWDNNPLSFTNLTEVINRQDIHETRQLVQAAIETREIDQVDYHGRGLLHLHLQNYGASPAITNLLCSAHLGVDVRDNEGKTPLFEILNDTRNQQGHTDVFMDTNALENVKVLVEYGADVNTVTYDGRETPLIRAIEQIFYSCTDYLLYCRANPHFITPAGKIPLQFAAVNQSSRIMSLLFRWGVDPDALCQRFTAGVFCGPNDLCTSTLKRERENKIYIEFDTLHQKMIALQEYTHRMVGFNTEIGLMIARKVDHFNFQQRIESLDVIARLELDEFYRHDLIWLHEDGTDEMNTDGMNDIGELTNIEDIGDLDWGFDI